VYEEYTADELKEEGGEFFTNRLVVGLLVKMLDPSPDDVVLDPAGGTGGFCTAALRHMRKKILDSSSSEGIKRRLSEQVVNHVFYIDIKHRLVKIAKTAMLLTGDGHQGCIQGDSLNPIQALQASFLEWCRPQAVTRVRTVPPSLHKAHPVVRARSCADGLSRSVPALRLLYALLLGFRARFRL